jgi:glutathione S-transferase
MAWSRGDGQALYALVRGGYSAFPIPRKERRMTSLPLAALITLLVLLLMFLTALNVGRARGLYGIMAPAVSGHEMFDRAFRIQMNTLESAAVMLPALWLYAGFIGDRGAALLGAIWLAGRVWYAFAYHQDPKKRSAGFGIGFLAFAGLWVGALWGVAGQLLR